MGPGADRNGKRPSRADLPVGGRLAGARRARSHRSRPCDNRHEHPRSEIIMNAHLKIRPDHLQRGAYLYIRQSSMRQVVENAEGARRQYGLRGRAVALGWRDEQIIVIDSDQGESGASAAWREGFQRLVSDVGMGHAGIVMGLEVSRLARNNADWQRLLEICAFADTLILDEDGVYDPASFNDRLLLGLKGTMSEAELHVIKARLRGGILNKARRGEFRCPLPTGLVYDHSGNVALDPDMQVRETIIHFFETFSRVGSASQTVKAFRTEGLLFPSRLHNSETVFRPLTASTAVRVLNNPRYAGAYGYGRRQFRRTIDGKKTVRARDNDDWLACIPDAHPGYISWEQHQENLKILKANGHGYDTARASIPREGPALLQGRAVCGQCGRHFRVRYAARRGRQEAWYICDRAHTYRGEPVCQSIAGPPVDEAIGMLIAEQMTPAAVELALEVRQEIQARHEEADRLRCRAIERAQTEADLAQRRFMLVDPNNRLVADTLEGEWNEKLRILANAREERERARQHDQFVLDEAVHERLVAMTVDFNKLWANPDTPNRERKRLLAHIIEDVTLIKLPAEGTTKVHVRFKGGKIQTLTTMSPRSSAQQIKTQPGIVELIDKLLDHHIYSEIADLLNQQGYRPGESAEC
jgi:DNA invertase Pin-like site-specific DNA recombinase